MMSPLFCTAVMAQQAVVFRIRCLLTTLSSTASYLTSFTVLASYRPGLFVQYTAASLAMGTCVGQRETERGRGGKEEEEKEDERGAGAF